VLLYDDVLEMFYDEQQVAVEVEELMKGEEDNLLAD
jgi:hypothetical protein